MGNWSSSIGIQWTPPGASENSGNSTLSLSGTENAQSVGTIDIPNGTVANTSFSIPFGSVDAAKFVLIRNRMSSEIGLRLNGSVADDLTLGPGQIFAIGGATAGTTVPLTQLDIVNTTDPASTEFVDHWVYGD